MTAALPYIYRWDRHGRKGQPCRVTARSGISRPGSGPHLVVFGDPPAKRFNTISIEFADGFTMATSGNAIQKSPGNP